MVAKLANFLQRFAQKPHAQFILFVFAVFEGFILPFPSDVLLMAIILAHPKHPQRLAFLNAAGTALGGVIGYTIGRFAFEYLADPALTWLCQYQGQMCPAVFIPELQQLFHDYGIWFIGAAAILPILPYKLGILFAGMAKMPFIPFVLVSLAARWARYAVVAFVVARYGRPTLLFLEQRFRWVCMSAAACGLVIFLGFNYF